MKHPTEVFISIHVAKALNAIAIADGGRGAEVRFIDEVDASQDAMRRILQRITAKYGIAHFCYEAGPIRYELYRLIIELGHSYIVVAPSLVPKRTGDRVKTDRRDAVMLARRRIHTRYDRYTHTFMSTICSSASVIFSPINEMGDCHSTRSKSA